MVCQTLLGEHASARGSESERSNVCIVICHDEPSCRLGAMGVAAGLAATLAPGGWRPSPTAGADLIVFNGRLATQDARRSFASAVAIRDGALCGRGDRRRRHGVSGGHDADD